MTLKFMVVASEIKEGLDLTLIAEATKSHSAGESNPKITIAQYLEHVKNIDEFTKRIPVELILNNNSFSDINAEITKSAEKHFGVTYSWKETGYILINGKKLDFSGKHNGAPRGYSTEHAQRIELILDVAAKNPQYSIEDVVGEVAAVVKDAFSASVFLQDVYADERADVFKAMRDFGKTYLTRDQLETLESRGLSLNLS